MTVVKMFGNSSKVSCLIVDNDIFALSKVSAATGYRYEVGKSNFPA